MWGHYDYSFVGNVLGTPDQNPAPYHGFAYEDLWPWNNDPIGLWRLGYNPENWDAQPDARVVNTVHDEIVVEAGVKIPMRDGTLLDAMIWRPAAPGRYPVLVERVGYDLEPRASANGEFYARHGYVVVAQNVRGAYASEGEYTMRTSIPRALCSSGLPWVPGTRIMSPKAAKITSGFCAMDKPSSMRPMGSTQTGQPGPWISSIFSGRMSLSPKR